MSIYFNQYLYKLYLKKAAYLVFFIIIIFLSLFSVFSYKINNIVKFSTALIISISIIYIRKMYIDIKKIYAGIKAEIKVNQTLKLSGVLFSRNVTIKGSEIDNIVYFPVFTVIETKYGKGKIYKSGDKYYVGRKVVSEKMLKQIDRNLKIIKTLFPRNTGNAKGVLCFSEAEGILEVSKGGIYLVGNQNLSFWLKNQEQLKLDTFNKSLELKKIIENY